MASSDDPATSRVTSNEVAAAAGGVSRKTLLTWRKAGILPEPVRVGGPGRGTPYRWPEEAIARAQFARRMLDRGDHSLAEVAELIKRRWEAGE